MAYQVMELLEEIHAGGTTIVMVTHDPQLAKRAARNVHLSDGRVSAEDLMVSQNFISQPTRLNGGEPLAAQA